MGSADKTVELTVEETNALRAKLGLKPLRVSKPKDGEAEKRKLRDEMDAQISEADPTRLYVSSHEVPNFPGTGVERGAEGAYANVVNVPLRPGSGSAAFCSSTMAVSLAASAAPAFASAASRAARFARFCWCFFPCVCAR